MSKLKGTITLNKKNWSQLSPCPHQSPHWVRRALGKTFVTNEPNFGYQKAAHRLGLAEEILSLQVTESFFLLKGDLSLFQTLLLGLDFFSRAITASFSFLRISRTRAWKTSSM